MGIFSRFKDKTTHGVKAPFKAAYKWGDFERSKDVAENLKTRFGELTSPSAGPVIEESFEEAAERHGVDEKEVQAIQERYFYSALLFLLIAFSVFAYFLYHLTNLHLRGAFVSLGLTFFSLSMAFRYHFWYFQVKNRRLGCTFGDWVQSTIFRKKS